MLGLTADIAEELLLIKDAERDTLPDGLKLKIISLAELAATVDEHSVEEESPAPEEMVSELSETEVETPAEEAQEETPAAEEILPEEEEREAEGNEEPVAEEVASSDAADTDADAADDATDDVDAEAESAEFEEEADANADIEDSPREEEVEETADVVIEPEPDTEPEGDVEPVVVSSYETVAAPSENSDAATEESPDRGEQQPEVVEQPAEEPVEQPVEQKSDNRNIAPADLYRAFSINDAFYFRREIFGGSRQQMMEALVRISMLPDRQALREYLVERLALNLDESPGKEFYQSLSSFL